MDVDAWGSEATSVLLDDRLALRTDLKGLDLKMWELQTRLDRYAARAEANVPKHLSIGKVESLERQQTDGHLGDHLFSAVEEGESGVGDAEIFF